MGEADSDDELMILFQRERDYTAFEKLFRQHKDALLCFLVRLLRNLATAHDASQQTWLKVIAVARKGTYIADSGVRFRTWLFTLARHHVIDEYQRRFAATKTVALTDELRDEFLEGAARADFTCADPEDHVHRQQLVKRLNEAVWRLPLEQREVIALWAAGLDVTAIASITGAPRDTVQSRRKYALAKLRDALSDLLMEDEQR